MFGRRYIIPDSEDIPPEGQPGQSTLHQKSVTAEVHQQWQFHSLPDTQKDWGSIKYDVIFIY